MNYAEKINLLLQPSQKGKSACWIYLPVVAGWLWALRHKDLKRWASSKTLMLVKLTGEI